MTDSDLTKYDWRRRLGDGGSGDYCGAADNVISLNYPISHFLSAEVVISSSDFCILGGLAMSVRITKNAAG